LGVISFLPALALLYFVLGAREEFFRHQAMYLAVLGGMVLGVLLAIAETFVLLDAGVLVIVVAFPLMETMGKTMFLGLPRFRDNEETVLLGGAAGATMAAILVVFYGRLLVGQPTTWELIVKVAGTAIGFTGAHFVSGLRLGMGPAEGTVLGGFIPSLLWLAPAHVLLGLLGLSARDGRVIVEPLTGDYLWAILLAAYGLAIFWWRSAEFVREGLPMQARRRWRREQRGRG